MQQFTNYCIIVLGGDIMLSNENAKQYIHRLYGFSLDKIILLELSESAFSNVYVMFEVCGIEYQSHNGLLSIYRQN